MHFNSKYKNMEEKEDTVVHLKSVTRIVNIPIIETSWTYASNFYTRIKVSSPLINWSLSTAEATIKAAVEHTMPVVSKFEGPINLADSLVCKSLDLVEKQLPIITLPPELIFASTKDYVSTTIVQPVLKRADSVKQFSREQAHTVLESKYTNFAAYRFDSALDLADRYIDQYLPSTSGMPEETIETNNPSGSKAVQALQKADRVSRKLQRRLTQRTLAEARALKKQSEDTLQTLMYLGELLVKDPKAVFELSKELWTHLSEDEPENQAPPTTLEQLIVMLTRETARRVVHLLNYTRSAVTTLPQNVNISLQKAAHFCSDLADTLVKAAHLEETRNAVLLQARQHIADVQLLVASVHKYATSQLEMLTKISSRKDDCNSVTSTNGDVQQTSGKPVTKDRQHQCK